MSESEHWVGILGANRSGFLSAIWSIMPLTGVELGPFLGRSCKSVGVLVRFLLSTQVVFTQQEQLFPPLGSRKTLSAHKPYYTRTSKQRFLYVKLDGIFTLNVGPSIYRVGYLRGPIVAHFKRVVANQRAPLLATSTLSSGTLTRHT